MEEIFNSVLKAAKGAAQSLGDVALAKISVAGLFAVIFSGHGTALMAFVVLILIDLATKWLSLTYRYLLDRGVCQEQAGLWQCARNMGNAFNQKYITSEMMKTKFAGKLILYMI